MFDLFKLHDSEEDKHPISWIRVGGDKLAEELRKVLIEILGRGITLEQLSKTIGKELNSKQGTIEEQLRKLKLGKNKCLSIPVIERLIKIWNENFFKEEKWKLIKLVEWVSNCPKWRPVRLPKELTKDLAKILGVHAADGSLIHRTKKKSGTHTFTWKVVEGHKNNLECLQRWILDTFNIFTRIKKSPKENAFEMIVDNKVLFRFLNKVIGFPVGDKTNIISMPDIIKNSNQEMKRCFALGVLTFDGCVSCNGNIQLDIKSEKLRDEIASVLENDGIKVSKSFKEDKHGKWNLSSRILTNENKFLEFFPKGTLQWKRANLFVNHIALEDITKLFEGNSNNRIKIKNMLETVKKLKIFDRTTLRKQLKCKNSTLVTHLKLLETANILKKIKCSEPINLPIPIHNLDESTPISLSQEFINKIFSLAISKLSTQSNLSKKLGVNPSTVTGWKKKTHGITIKNLKKLLEICKINFEEASNQIKRVWENIFVLN